MISTEEAYKRLNPQATAEVDIRYEGGYFWNHLECKDAFRPKYDAPFFRSYRIKHLMHFATAHSIIPRIDELYDGKEMSASLKRDILEDALASEELNRMITGHFKSEFVPIWMRFYKNQPGDDLPPAAYWHCDAGPREHLKILLYLNSSKKHGGSTAVVDEKTTILFKAAGYVFGDIHKRVGVLAPLAEKLGIPWSPFIPSFDAGDAIIFEPQKIMHRAIWPTTGNRYMIQICLMPSRYPWNIACEKYGMPVSNNGWPIFPEMKK